MVLAKDVAGDDPGLSRFGKIGGTGGEDGVTVVGAAVSGEEADEALVRRRLAIC